MQRTVVIVGAGGKMGARAVEKIGCDSNYHVVLCETNPERAHALQAEGSKVTPMESALSTADFVVMAVRATIGKVYKWEPVRSLPLTLPIA